MRLAIPTQAGALFPALFAVVTAPQNLFIGRRI
jgi:hypothetical protein